MTDKEQAQSLLDSLPDDVTFEQIEYHLYVRQKIAQGLEDIQAGRVIDHEEVVKRMQKWRIE
jgi:predicted transcriptional regulator